MSAIERDKPFYNPGRQGNAGGEVTIRPHWSQLIRCSDERCVFGYGDTEAEAIQDAERKLEAAEKEIAAASPVEQIKMILARCPDRIYDNDQERLLRLLCKIVAP